VTGLWYENDAAEDQRGLPSTWKRDFMKRPFPWLLPLLLLTGCAAAWPTIQPYTAIKIAGDHRGKEGALQFPGSRIDPITADLSR
jgi:hypothetical protein